MYPPPAIEPTTTAPAPTPGAAVEKAAPKEPNYFADTMTSAGIYTAGNVFDSFMVLLHHLNNGPIPILGLSSMIGLGVVSPSPVYSQMLTTLGLAGIVGKIL